MVNKITTFPILEETQIEGDPSFKPTGTSGFAKEFKGDIYCSKGMFGNGSAFIEIGAEYIQSNNYSADTTGWRISYDGTTQLNDLTLTSGTIRYQKTSFTDSTNSGYYISSEGVYFGSGADATKFKFTISDGTVDLIGTISSRSTATLASAIDSSGHFIDANLNTSSKKILKDFTLEGANFAGALKAGDITWDTSTGLITGGTGFVINDKGIFGALSGVAKVSILNDGTATFAGTLSAAAGTLGTITSGSIYSGLFSTASSGATDQRVVINTSDDTLRFYDSSNNQIIGIGDVPADWYLSLEAFTTTIGGIRIYAQSGVNYTDTLLQLSILNTSATGYCINATHQGASYCAYLQQTGTAAHINLNGDPTVSSPNDGDLWFDGTDLKLRVSTTTHILTKSAANETISGTWAFSAFPTTPSAAPTTNYQVANKKFVDDSIDDVASGGYAIYGNGKDGNATISSGTQLTTDKYYNDLTINDGIALEPRGNRIFVKGTLTFVGSGNISNSAGAGGNGNNGGNATGSSIGTGGTGGAAGTASYGDYLLAGAAGKIGSNGGSGGNPGFSGSNGAAGTAGADATPRMIGVAGTAGGDAGAGGNSNGGTGGGGAAGGGTDSSGIINYPCTPPGIVVMLDADAGSNPSKFQSSSGSGSAGGGGGGGGGSQRGGGGAGGGGSGGTGGFVCVYARTVNFTASSRIQSVGGAGGTGGNGGNGYPNAGGGGGGGGGAGGSGGVIALVYSYSNQTHADILSTYCSVAGGTGGTGGTPGNSPGVQDGISGSNGTNGATGTQIIIQN